MIGPGGGTLRVGPFTLVVPKGALTSRMAITGEVVPGSVNSVRFLPEGLRFLKGAPLTMSYSNCAGVDAALKIVYTSEALDVLEILNSVTNFKTKTVTAKLEHFSRYAISY